jgi:hypothetical protein
MISSQPGREMPTHLRSVCSGQASRNVHKEEATEILEIKNLNDE